MNPKLILILACTLMLSGCLATKQKSQPLTNAAPMINNEAAMVQSPNWTIGDSWVWSDGYGLNISDVSDGLTTFDRTDVRGVWYKRRGLFKQEEKSSSTHRKVIFRSVDVEKKIFPLKRGNAAVFQREYLANEQLRVHRTSWIVDGQETITVPAGTFDCWVLSMRTRGVDSGWTGYEKWWYSPEIKNYVRLQYRYGNAPAGVRVLKEYKVQ